MPPELPDDLPPGYYLNDVEYLLNFVVERYEHLLSEDEKRFYHCFSALPLPARRLYVRLSNRKGPHFRLDRLAYEEIETVADAAEALVEAGLATFEPPALLESFQLCTKEELLALRQLADRPRSTRRSDLMAAIIELIRVEAVALNPLAELNISTITALGLDCLRVFRLLFFGNFHQDMTEFVLHELVTPFEQYDLTGTAAFFENRGTIEEMIMLQNLGELSHEVIAADESGEGILAFAQLLPMRRDHSLLARRHDRIVNRLARQLERLGRPEDALDLYGRSFQGNSRERRTRLYEKLGRFEEAFSHCQAIVSAPLDEAELEFGLFFGDKLARKAGLDSDLPPREITKPAVNSIVVPRLEGRVELCAVSHYESETVRCFYVENRLFRSLFGLAFWDIIFAPVSGAFFHPFQRGPADLYTDDFVPARRDLIQTRCREMAEQSRMTEIITTTFAAKAGIANQFVNWQWLTPELLELALSHIPSHDLLAVFDRMLRDLKQNCSGLPDLIIFENDAYRLLEIKGPGDKIQKNQERWFRYFARHAIPAELVNVEYGAVTAV